MTTREEKIWSVIGGFAGLVLAIGAFYLSMNAIGYVFTKVQAPVVIEGPDVVHRTWMNDCDARHGEYVDDSTEPDIALCVADNDTIIVTYRR